VSPPAVPTMVAVLPSHVRAPGPVVVVVVGGRVVVVVGARVVVVVAMVVLVELVVVVGRVVVVVLDVVVVGRVVVVVEEVVVVGRVVVVVLEVVVELVELVELVVPLPVVRMSMHQPPLMSTVDWPWSSVTHRFHVPLGLSPLKVESVEEPEGVGAGGTKASSSEVCWSTSLSSSTGRKVPLSRWVSAGTGLAAWSSKVTSAAFTGPDEVLLSPPTSDISITLAALLGADSMMSASSIQCRPPASGWVVMSSKVTFTSVIVPISPETVMGDG
jgi:hypothetical protein